MMEVRQDVQRLASRYSIGGPLMYPRPLVFTWVKPNRHLPWMLASIDELEEPK